MDFIYDFWVEQLPMLADYGTLPYVLLTIITVMALIRLVAFVPLYMMGLKKRF